MCLGVLLDGVEEGVESGAAEDVAAKNDGEDFLGVVDVGERIGIEEDEVGDLVGLDGAVSVELAQKFGGIFRGGLQGLHGREAGLDEIREIFVKGRAREDVGRGRVGASHDANAGSLHLDDDDE